MVCTVCVICGLYFATVLSGSAIRTHLTICRRVKAAEPLHGVENTKDAWSCDNAAGNYPLARFTALLYTSLRVHVRIFHSLNGHTILWRRVGLVPRPRDFPYPLSLPLASYTHITLIHAPQNFVSLMCRVPFCQRIHSLVLPSLVFSLCTHRPFDNHNIILSFPIHLSQQIQPFKLDPPSPESVLFKLPSGV